MSLVKSYEGGRESHARTIVQSLFEEYLSVEELFSDNIQVSWSMKHKFFSNENMIVQVLFQFGWDSPKQIPSVIFKQMKNSTSC